MRLNFRSHPINEQHQNGRNAQVPVETVFDHKFDGFPIGLKSKPHVLQETHDSKLIKLNDENADIQAISVRFEPQSNSGTNCTQI